jgi:RimJ/RimL family protein N-acetyltransferase
MKALLALVRLGFFGTRVGPHRGGHRSASVPSTRSLERLGFTKEGHLRQRWIVNGEVSDSAFTGCCSSTGWRSSVARFDPIYV